MHKYAVFNDGIPPSTGVTHLIREEQPGKWTIVATLPGEVPWQDLVDQLNAAYDMANQDDIEPVREVVDAVRTSAGLPVPPRMPAIPHPPVGLMKGLT